MFLTNTANVNSMQYIGGMNTQEHNKQNKIVNVNILQKPFPTVDFNMGIAGLHPQSNRHFAWQSSARVSQTLRTSYFSHVTAATT